MSLRDQMETVVKFCIMEADGLSGDEIEKKALEGLRFYLRGFHKFGVTDEGSWTVGRMAKKIINKMLKPPGANIDVLRAIRDRLLELENKN